MLCTPLPPQDPAVCKTTRPSNRDTFSLFSFGFPLEQPDGSEAGLRVCRCESKETKVPRYYCGLSVPVRCWFRLEWSYEVERFLVDVTLAAAEVKSANVSQLAASGPLKLLAQEVLGDD
jgi:hypothetical protein